MAERIVERLETAGWSCEVAGTEGEGDADRLAAAAGDADVVVAIGGDGTLFEVAAGLGRTDADVPVLFIPAGTTNAVARAFALPGDADEAFALLQDGEPTALDTGFLPDHDRTFLLMATVGYPARVTTDAHRELKDRFGFFAYVWAALRNLVRLHVVDVEVEIDGRRHRFGGIGGVLVANIGSFADPQLRLIPGADPRDGRLEVVVLGARRWWDWLRLAALAVIGRATQPPEVTVLRGGSITVTGEGPLPVQCDGEDLGSTPLRAEVRARSLHLILPRETATRGGDAD